MNEKVLQAVLRLKDEMSKPLKNATKAMKDVQDKAKGVTDSMNKMGSAMKSTGSSMVKAGAGMTATFGSVLGASAKVGMEFEASMSKVQAVMGASAEDLKALEKAAREAGSKTTKSASEAANALEYMGLAGWSVKESQEALMPVLRLSEAGAMDLGLTSDLVTDSMSSLGLKMSEVGQSGLEKYLDMVAKTSNSSNTSIQQLMEGLVVVGGTANNLGVPMEELNAIMGVMANRGTKGSEAANSLNSILINMTTGAGEAGKAMEALGLSAFDSQGNFKGLEVMFGDLNKKLEGMTDEQKNYYLAMIGGKTQVDALQKILAGVGDEYTDLKGKIVDSQGALNTMADVMNDNSKGGIAQLKSALEEAGIAIYTTLKPAIATVTETLQNAVAWFNNLDEGTKKNIVTILAIGLAIGGFLVVGGTLLMFIGGLVSAFAALSAAGVTLAGVVAFLTSPILLVIAAVALLVTGCLLLKKAWDTNFNGIRDKTKEVCDKILGWWESLKTMLMTPINAVVNIFKKDKGTSSDDSGKKSAFGTKRVVGNDVPYRLHQGERVLTRQQADELDRNGGLGNGINVQVSNLTVREEADINKIAKQLVRELKIAQFGYVRG